MVSVWQEVDNKVIDVQYQHLSFKQAHEARGYSSPLYGNPPVHSMGLQQHLDDAGHAGLAEDIEGANTTQFLSAVYVYPYTPKYVKERIYGGRNKYRYNLPGVKRTRTKAEIEKSRKTRASNIRWNENQAYETQQKRLYREEAEGMCTEELLTYVRENENQVEKIESWNLSEISKSEIDYHAKWQTYLMELYQERGYSYEQVFERER